MRDTRESVLRSAAAAAAAARGADYASRYSEMIPIRVRVRVTAR